MDEIFVWNFIGLNLSYVEYVTVKIIVEGGKLESVEFIAYVNKFIFSYRVHVRIIN